jgi:serpin B
VINGLGARLHPTLSAEQADANSILVFSPASVGIALAMTSVGAGGDTSAEMHETLGIVDPSIHESMGELAEVLTTGPSADSFTLANSLWVQDGFAIEDAFMTTLTDTYHSEPFREDFEGDPATAVDDINSWVADATSERITRAALRGDITDLTRLVLANAVHLDAEWVSPFTPDSTRPDEFT